MLQHVQHPSELMSHNGSPEAAPASPIGCHEMGLLKRPRRACWGCLQHPNEPMSRNWSLEAAPASPNG
eukprot:14716463-Alexandrium_andersonii.AAC.1